MGRYVWYSPKTCPQNQGAGFFANLDIFERYVRYSKHEFLAFLR